MSVNEDEPGVICWVTPEGEVVCEKVGPGEPSSALKKGPLPAQIKAALPAGNWGPNKIKLALRILEVLAESELPDTPNIPRRAGEIADATRHLLSANPPSVLLFNYSTLPADVVGAFFLNKAELVEMQRLYGTFKNPKQP